MKLPNGDRAIVEVEKLRDYCLSPQHPRGRHKARVFASRLGITAQHVDILQDALVRAARQQSASLGFADEYGQRYVIDFDMNGPSGRATVRSSWIVRSGESIARLTSCYVL
jgi:hypothetical protein